VVGPLRRRAVGRKPRRVAKARERGNDAAPAELLGDREQPLPAARVLVLVVDEVLDRGGKSLGIRALMCVSLLAIPFLLSFFPLYATLRGVKVYEQFVEGAKDA